MSGREWEEFLYITNNYCDKEYFFSRLVCIAGPTLAKEKPSSLLSFNNCNRNLKLLWEKYKDEINNNFDYIDFIELRRTFKSTVVLFFNRPKLETILRDKRNILFLRKFGYKVTMTLDETLEHLSKRYENVCPHEIGIFLGYPIEDVNTFVHCPNRKCKMVGYWKVYHDIEKAKYIFNKYDKIKYEIISSIMKGTNPTEIISFVS